MKRNDNPVTALPSLNSVNGRVRLTAVLPEKQYTA